jgi:hypothetical protein
MIISIQLAIIQAFTVLWDMKFEQMVVIFSIFCQKMKTNNNNHQVCIKFIFKSWVAKNQYTPWVFKKDIKVWRSTILLIFFPLKVILNSLSNIFNGRIIFISWFQYLYLACLVQSQLLQREKSKWCCCHLSSFRELHAYVNIYYKHDEYLYFYLILPKILNDHPMLQFYLSESCKSLNKSQMYIFYHISIQKRDFLVI